jgi:hydroxymethylbilane synthase
MASVAKVIIGTRGSSLALWQANWIADRLRAAHPGLDVRLAIIKTQGDRIVRTALPDIGGKGLFTKEIEDALRAGKVDFAVHSLKDLPTDVPEGLNIAAFATREDPRDALVTAQGLALADLAEGASVGTSSPRRQAQLRAARPDLRFVDLRGNVETRIRKMREQGLAATVLAMAGLNRLGIAGVGIQPLDPEVCLPAVGQGILAVETRDGDGRVSGLVAVLDDGDARACAIAERTVLSGLGGGCQVPMGALAEVGENGKLRLRAAVASRDGARIIRVEMHGNADAAQELGETAARALLDQGAGEALLSCGASPDSLGSA